MSVQSRSFCLSVDKEGEEGKKAVPVERVDDEPDFTCIATGSLLRLLLSSLLLSSLLLLTPETSDKTRERTRRTHDERS